jgi:hypothetical protein
VQEKRREWAEVENELESGQWGVELECLCETLASLEANTIAVQTAKKGREEAETWVHHSFSPLFSSDRGKGGFGNKWRKQQGAHT